MHIAVALNLLGDIVTMSSWLFFIKAVLAEYPILASNLRFIRFVFSVLSLWLSLKIHLQPNLSKNAETMSLPLKPTRLVFSNLCMPPITPNPL